jgi:flagellar hook-associated protein 1 FlgK
MSMLSIGTTALTATQSALSTTSHNISNINTEGYNRQRAEFSTYPPDFNGTHYIGSGVEIGTVERLFDSFLATQIRTFTAQEAQSDTILNFAHQVDDLLGSDELSLSSGLEGFFNAMNEVANDPTSISTRQVFLTQADILATRFNTLSQQLDGFTDQVNTNLQTNVTDVNNLTRGIADMNQAIVEASNGSDVPPNDLLDKRDKLITDLSKLVSVTTVPDENGSIGIFVGNGQAVVLGSTAIDLNIIPNAADPTLNDIGYGPTNINITSQISGGSLGGLLTVRSDIILNSKAELDSLALSVTTELNEQHRKGITLTGALGGDLFLPAAGDAGSIRLAVTDPRALAIAFPVSSTAATLNTGIGQIEIESIDGVPPLTLPYLAANVSLTFDSSTNQYTVADGTDTATFSYDPASQSGLQVDLGALTAAWTTPVELTVKVSGVPANTDVFTLGNSAAIGDNRNALALAELQTTKILNGGTQTFGDAYGVIVANVATRTNQADISQRTQQGLLDQTVLRYESVSGVNLDEEAANLIKFQQSYQAAAQIITVSNAVFNALINAV